MCRALIIGAGGVGTVVTQKIAANPVFSDVMLASRTKSKCDAVAAAIGGNRVKTAQVDADNVAELCELFRAFKPDIVVNVALPYQDLTIMDDLPRVRLQLPRHGQLRAARRGALRV
ncbi:Saccharopine dehydrogenase, partial [human gut metagenome]